MSFELYSERKLISFFSVQNMNIVMKEKSKYASIFTSKHAINPTGAQCVLIFQSMIKLTTEAVYLLPAFQSVISCDCDSFQNL